MIKYKKNKGSVFLGYDVGAYKTIRKELKRFQVFKVGEKYKPNQEDNIEVLKQIHSLKDELIFEKTHYSSCYVQDGKSLNKYHSRTKKLVDILTQSENVSENNQFARWIREKQKEGYSIGRDYTEFYSYFCFKELEEVEKYEFIEEDYIDIKYPNGEIPKTFIALEKEYDVSLYKYLINDEDLYFNWNTKEVEEKINYNTTHAILDVKNIYQHIEDKYTREVLSECLRVWALGGKFVYNR